MNRYVSFFWIFILFSGTLFAEFKNGLPSNTFRDALIANHFDYSKAMQMTIGIEKEIGVADPLKTMQFLQKEHGGTIRVEKIGTQNLYFLDGSNLGTIRLEPNNLQLTMDRMIERNIKDFRTSPLGQGLAKATDWISGTWEIVTDPISYDQVQNFGKTLDKLSLEMHPKGTGYTRPISEQVNVGIDSTKTVLIKNILANYYRNQSEIREDVKPNKSRLGYIRDLSPEGYAQITDPTWQPTRQELFEWYEKSSHPKLSRVQLFNALISDDKIFPQVQQPTDWHKPYPKRPVAEFREPNSVVSSKQDPTASSRALMRETQFAISMVLASQTSGNIKASEEMKQFGKHLLALNQTVLPTTPVEHTFGSFLHGKDISFLETKPLEEPKVVLVNPKVSRNWGLHGNKNKVEKILGEFAREIVPGENGISKLTTDKTAPFATRHSDGFGGLGDGRAIIVKEDPHTSKIVSTKGVGLTPYVLQDWAVWIGAHIGGRDGRASLAEGLRTYVLGEIYHQIGIPSERILTLIDNKKESDSIADGKEPSSLIVREYPGGGIRNSHLNTWDVPTTAKALEHLKRLASKEVGFQLTNRSYLMLDAVRSGQLAARMQDAYLINGTLTDGNTLAYPGIIDLNLTRVMQAPDPMYTTLGARFRFESQTRRMRQLVEKRQKQFGKVDQDLKKVPVKTLFQESYEREQQILALKRLGLSPEVSNRILENHPKLAKEYTEKLWKAQTNHLHSDFRILQKEIPRLASFIQMDPARTAQALVPAISDPARMETGSHVPRLQKLNSLFGRFSDVPVKKASELLTLGTKLLNAGLVEKVKMGGKPISAKRFYSESAERAKKVAAIQIPTKEKIENLVAQVTQAQKTGQSLETPIKELHQLVDDLSKPHPERIDKFASVEKKIAKSIPETSRAIPKEGISSEKLDCPTMLRRVSQPDNFDLAMGE